MVECTSCRTEINLENRPKQGETIICPGCNIQLKVRNTNPLVLQIAQQEEVDWGEYWGE